MAYNKAKEEKKWRLWKEAEENKLRSLGVDEDTIEKLRVHDWEVFNSDRRFYQRLKDVATYLEEMEADVELPEIRSVDDLLNSIENQKLHQALIMVDKLTLQIALWKMEGFSSSEISKKCGLSVNAVNFRMWHLRKKLKNFLKSNIKTVATGYGMRGKNSHPIFLVWREWECSLKSEYPFAKYFLFVIVMSISVCSGAPRPADKQKSDERW